MAGAAGGADLADDGEDQVLRRQAERQIAFDGDAHVLRRLLNQRLRRQHVLHLGGADAEGECAEGAVRCRVAVAADDGQAGLGDPELGANDMHDALVTAGHVKQRNAVARAILRQGLDLQAGVLIHDRELAILGGDRMIHHREGEVGPANLAPGSLQAGKSLRHGIRARPL